MENLGKKILIKSSVKDALINSTSHGIPKIVSADKWSVKVVWILFTVVSTALCAFLIAQNIINYFQFEVNTKIRAKYEYLTIFPSVTVCNFGRFSSEYGYNFSIMAKSIQLKSNESIRSDTNFARQYALAQNLSEFKKYGDSLSKLVSDYDFESRTLNLTLDFTYFFSVYFGNCYTFNPAFYENGTSRFPTMTTASGHNYGLDIELYMRRFKKSRGSSEGVVFVHEFGSHPLTAAPIFVLPQRATYIGIKRRRSTQLPKPYSSCDEGTDNPDNYDSEIYKAIHNTSFKYSQSLCIELCFQRLAIENCSCFYYGYAIFAEGKPCLKESEYRCIANFYSNLVNRDYLNTICLPKCPLECISVDYTKTISVYSLMDNDPDMADVTVFLEDYIVTEMEEAAVMDMAVLLSNIGGIAGLFLGVSFLSFIEILAVLAEVIIIYFSKEKIHDLQENLQKKNVGYGIKIEDL